MTKLAGVLLDDRNRAIFGNFNLSGPQGIADLANGGTAKSLEKVDGRHTWKSRCTRDIPVTNRQKHVWHQRRRKHDVIDILVGLPARIVMLRVRNPEAGDLLAKRFVWQKEINVPP